MFGMLSTNASVAWVISDLKNFLQPVGNRPTQQFPSVNATKSLLGIEKCAQLSPQRESVLAVVLFRPRFLDRSDKGSGVFGESFPVFILQNGFADEARARTKGDAAGLDEFVAVLWTDAACWDDFQLGQGRSY
jgi:hypothetical protein